MKLENRLFSSITDALIAFDNNFFVQVRAENSLTWSADEGAKLEQ